MVVAGGLIIGGLGVARLTDPNFTKIKDYAALGVLGNMYVPGLIMWKKGSDREILESSYDQGVKNV